MEFQGSQRDSYPTIKTVMIPNYLSLFCRTLKLVRLPAIAPPVSQCRSFKDILTTLGLNFSDGIAHLEEMTPAQDGWGRFGRWQTCQNGADLDFRWRCTFSRAFDIPIEPWRNPFRGSKCSSSNAKRMFIL